MPIEYTVIDTVEVTRIIKIDANCDYTEDAAIRAAEELYKKWLVADDLKITDRKVFPREVTDYDQSGTI